MKRLLFIMILIIGCGSNDLKYRINQVQKKEYDLVLIHGLASIHHWSDAFLRVCLHYFGSGNVYVIYTNDSTEIRKRTIDNMDVYFCGNSRNFSGGRDLIEKQVLLLKEKIVHLQKKYDLSKNFNIIGHSMGGLIARRYIYERPGTVVGLVTLGTPHQGSPLANNFTWVGRFIGAEKAILDLKPQRMKSFNTKYPVKDAPLALNGKIYTIEGDADGDTMGWGGELALGWEILHSIYMVDSDGLVPKGAAKIAGAIHLMTYNDYDHYMLVRKPDVAETACRYLK